MRRLALIVVSFVLCFGVYIAQAARPPPPPGGPVQGRPSPERQRELRNSVRDFAGTNNRRLEGRLRSLPDSDLELMVNITLNPEKLMNLSAKAWKEIGVTIFMGLIKRKRVNIIVRLLSTEKTQYMVEKFVISKMNGTVTKKLLKLFNDTYFKEKVLPYCQNVGLMPGARHEICQRVTEVYSKPNSKCPVVTTDTAKEMKGFITCFKKKCLLELKEKEKVKIALGSVPAEKLKNWLDKDTISRLLGRCSTLTKDDLKSVLGRLVEHAGDKCVKTIDPSKFCNVIREGGFGGNKEKGNPSKGFQKEIREKIKKGCAKDLRDTSFLSGNPDICKILKRSDVKGLTLPTNTSKRNELLEKCLCATPNWKQARQVIRMILKNVGSNQVSKWDKELVASAKYCICGLRIADFKNMPNALVERSWKSLVSAVKKCGRRQMEIGLTVKDASAPEVLGKGLIFLRDQIIKEHGVKNLNITASDIQDIRSRSARKKLRDLVFEDKPLIDQGAAAETLPLKDMRKQTIEDFGMGMNSTEEDAEKLEGVNLNKANSPVLNGIIVDGIGLPGVDSNWTDSIVKKVRRFAKGLLDKIIANLPLDQIGIIVEDESELDSKEIYSQCKSLVKKIKEESGLKKPSDFKTSSRETFGKCLNALDVEELQNLPEKTDVCNYFGALQGYEATGKKKSMAKFCENDLTDGGGAKSLKAEKLSILGNLVAFLPEEDLAEIPEEEVDGALSDIAEGFCDPVFKDESIDKGEAQKWNDQIRKKQKVLAAKIKNKADNINRLGCLVGGLEEKDIEDVSKETLEDNAEEIRKCKNKELKKTVNKKLQKQARRKRRDLSSATAEDVENLILDTLEADDITTMTCDAFNANIDDIGDGSYSESQLKAWVQLVKKCWNQDVKLYTADQLQNLGKLAPGFTADELGMMDLSEDESIEALGKESYTDEQLKKAWQQVKTKKAKEAKDLDKYELSSLGNFAKAMTSEEIGQIAVFNEVVDELGKIRGWSKEQLDQLKTMASKLYGSDASKWSISEIAYVGTVVGGFSKDELQNLSEEQLQYITNAGVSEIPPERLNALSLEQLTSMKPDQKAAITSAQKDGLSLTKRNALNKEAGSDLESAEDAGSSVVYSMVVLLVPFINALNFAN